MFCNHPTAAAEAQWMAAQANDSTFGKVFGLVSHVLLFAAAGDTWAARFEATSVMIFLAAMTSECYHLCGAFDVCGGLEPDAAHSADRFTATLIIFAFASLILYVRDTGARLLSDLISAHTTDDDDGPLPPPASTIESLDEPLVERLLAPLAASVLTVRMPAMKTRPATRFATVDDVPIYATLRFTGVILVLNTVVLALTVHFFPGGLYGAYVALILVGLDFLTYVSLYRPIPPRRTTLEGTLVPPLPPLGLAHAWATVTVFLLVASLVLYSVGDVTGRADTIPHSIWHLTAGAMLLTARQAVTAFSE